MQEAEQAYEARKEASPRLPPTQAPSVRELGTHYRVADKTRTETVRGGKRDAQRRLRELLTLADQTAARRTRIA